MATIYNSDLSREIQQGARLQVRDRMPSELAEKVVPVMEVNPKLLRRINIVKSLLRVNQTISTIWTTDTEKDFYICAANLSYIKDANSTATTIQITAVIDGATVVVLGIPTLTLTAGSNSLHVAFPFPIKVDRGTVVRAGADTAVANISTWAQVHGYYDDTSKS